MRTVVAIALVIGIASAQAQDATPEFDLPMDIDITATDDSEKTRASSWRDGLRFSLAWQGGMETNTPHDTTSHRLDARLRWEKLLGAQWFLSFDGKGLLRLSADQNLDPGEDWGNDWRLREALVQLSISQFTLKAGVQPVIWGEMDMFAVNDIMTPWDYAEFAFTSPEDARVSQPLLLLEWFSGRNTVSMVFNPHPAATRFPGGPISDVLAAQVPPPFVLHESFPETGIDYEAGIRYKRRAAFGDIALYAARVRSDFPSLQGDVDIINRINVLYPQYDSFGASANLSAGNFLWKVETAIRPQSYIPALTATYRDTGDLAIGFDYSAAGAWNLSVETLLQIIGGAPPLGYRRENVQTSARWSRSLRHDTINLVYYLGYQWQFGDTTHSLATELSINDYLKLGLNVTLFEIRNQNAPTAFIDDWDQAVLTLSWSI